MRGGRRLGEGEITGGQTKNKMGYLKIKIKIRGKKKMPQILFLKKKKKKRFF